MGVVVSMCQDDFGTVRQSRRLGMYLALAVAIMTVYLSITLKGDALVIALAVVYLGLVLRRLIVNPGRGFRLGSKQIDWYDRHGRASAPLEALAGVSIGRAPTGETLCVLRLADGRAVPLSGIEGLDQHRLMREFGRRGIPILA